MGSLSARTRFQKYLVPVHRSSVTAIPPTVSIMLSKSVMSIMLPVIRSLTPGFGGSERFSISFSSCSRSLLCSFFGVSILDRTISRASTPLMRGGSFLLRS